MTDVLRLVPPTLSGILRSLEVDNPKVVTLVSEVSGEKHAENIQPCWLRGYSFLQRYFDLAPEIAKIIINEWNGPLNTLNTP